LIQRIYHTLLIVLIITISGNAFAQKKDSTWQGSLTGIVRDSVHNYVLRSATVAIYIDNTADLLGYRLCNNYGEFNFNGLPIGIPLKIVVSFTGYQSIEKKFIIPGLKNELDMGNINLDVASKELSEVIVTSTPPPVRMNKDTLEFNAAAFKLDPNAQTEDLLRVLPGIVIWADGEITFNGRKVESVLVNGKPFFGSDARVATQNIPKDAVDKIQVYQRDKDPTKPITDSITEMNIKLKKGKEVGYFGKISGGYGTNKRYEGDGTINFFNPKTQLGIAVVSNNINKVANDIEFILRNSTYKGAGANIEYQSNFNITGLNNYFVGGLIYQHDFMLKPDYYNNNRFTGLYFAKNNEQNLLKKIQTVTYVNDSTNFIQQQNEENNNTQISQNASGIYEKLKNGNKFSVEAKYINNSNKIYNNNEWLSFNEKKQLLSSNNYTNNGIGTVNSISIATAYRHNKQNSDNLFSNYNINYTINVNENKNNTLTSSKYAVVQNPALNINIERMYSGSNKIIVHNLSFEIPELINKILGDVNFRNIKINFKNETVLTNNKETRYILDRGAGSNKFLVNAYLTNKRRETVLDEKPTVVFSKNIYKSLSSRYIKNFNAEFVTAAQFYYLYSTSDKIFQQFNKNYKNFLPAFNINYSNRQFGYHTNNYSMRLSKSAEYPSVQQLAPLTDSINQYYLEKGNPLLEEQDNTNMYLSFYHNSEDGKKNLSYHVSINAVAAKKYFTSSTNIDSLGRTIFTTVNADGYRMANISAEFKKAVKIKSSQLQFVITPNIFFNRQPNIINGLLNFYNNSTISYSPSINFTNKGWLQINISYKQSHSRYVQKGLNGNNFANLNGQSALSCNVNVTKKLSINSNAIYTKNTFNKIAQQTFTIWNASASYRFFKANTAEIKLAALDILKQNTGLINEGLNNNITQGTQNVLQQYFMVTLAYFPRQFGKKNK
jgi:hypothetical protein